MIDNTFDDALGLPPPSKNPDDDPAANMLCDWPGCQVRGNPYEDEGWAFWLRYYLWLPEGFYCPAHTAFIKEGICTGYFKDWPRDMSPEVARAEFVPLESEEGQRILRATDAEAHRAGFHVIYPSEDEQP